MDDIFCVGALTNDPNERFAAAMESGNGPNEATWNKKMTTTRLSSGASAFVPRMANDYVPQAPTSFLSKDTRESITWKLYRKKCFSVVVNNTKQGLEEVPGVVMVTTSKVESGCVFILQPDFTGGIDFDFDGLIENAQKVLMAAAAKSDNIFLMGYAGGKPFTMTEDGFEATFGAMQDKKKACWHIFKKGFCRHGAECNKQHPVALVTVQVRVQDCGGHFGMYHANTFEQNICLPLPVGPVEQAYGPVEHAYGAVEHAYGQVGQAYVPDDQDYDEQDFDQAEQDNAYIDPASNWMSDMASFRCEISELKRIEALSAKMYTEFDLQSLRAKFDTLDGGKATQHEPGPPPLDINVADLQASSFSAELGNPRKISDYEFSPSVASVASVSSDLQNLRASLQLQAEMQMPAKVAGCREAPDCMEPPPGLEGAKWQIAWPDVDFSKKNEEKCASSTGIPEAEIVVGPFAILGETDVPECSERESESTEADEAAEKSSEGEIDAAASAEPLPTPAVDLVSSSDYNDQSATCELLSILQSEPTAASNIDGVAEVTATSELLNILQPEMLGPPPGLCITPPPEESQQDVAPTWLGPEVSEGTERSRSASEVSEVAECSGSAGLEAAEGSGSEVAEFSGSASEAEVAECSGSAPASSTEPFTQAGLDTESQPVSASVSQSPGRKAKKLKQQRTPGSGKAKKTRVQPTESCTPACDEPQSADPAKPLPATYTLYPDNMKWMLALFGGLLMVALVIAICVPTVFDGSYVCETIACTVLMLVSSYAWSGYDVGGSSKGAMYQSKDRKIISED